MKKFIIRIMSLIIILTGISFFLNHAYKNIIKKDSTNQIIDKQFNKHRDSIKYLFIGDSHIMNGIDCRLIPNSFNYASGEECTIQNYYRLKSLIKSEYIPEHIYLNIDPSSLSEFRTKKIKHSEYWVNHMNFFEIANTIHNRKFYSRWLSGKYLSYIGNYHIFLRYFISNKTKRNPVFLGYKPRYENFSKDPNLKTKSVDRAYLYLKGYKQCDVSLVIYLERFMKLCEKHNIKITIIKMPLSAEYLKEVKQLTDLEKYYKKINTILLKYNCYQGYLDYQTIFLDHPEYFQNPDHLNNDGAQILSKIILKDFKFIE